MKYYFNGTLSQVLEKFENFDEKATPEEGVKTFEITVNDITEKAAIDEVADQEPAPAEPETTEPVVGSTPPTSVGGKKK